MQAFAPYFPVHYEATGTHVGGEVQQATVPPAWPRGLFVLLTTMTRFCPITLRPGGPFAGIRGRGCFCRQHRLCGHYAARQRHIGDAGSREYSVQGATRVDGPATTSCPFRPCCLPKSLFEEYGGLDEQMEVLKTGICGCAMQACSSLWRAMR